MKEIFVTILDLVAAIIVGLFVVACAVSVCALIGFTIYSVAILYSLPLAIILAIFVIIIAAVRLGKV